MCDCMGGWRGKSKRRLEAAPVGLLRREGGGARWELDLSDGLNLSCHGSGYNKCYKSNCIALVKQTRRGRFQLCSALKQNIFSELIDNKLEISKIVLRD